MYDRGFKELVKIEVEKLKDESVLKLLQSDAGYQKDSNSEGSEEDAFHQLDLTEKQRKKYIFILIRIQRKPAKQFLNP